MDSQVLAMVNAPTSHDNHSRASVEGFGVTLARLICS